MARRLPFSIPISSFFGNIYIDFSIYVLIGFLIFYSGIYARVKPKYANLSQHTFIYKEFVGKTRNLHEYFKKLEPDMRDYYLDNDVKVKYPMAALYQHSMDILSIPGDYRCSIGFLIPFSNEKLEKYFRKEGYNIKELPESTKCVQCEFPYRLDVPPAYPMITMKTNAPMRSFLH